MDIYLRAKVFRIRHITLKAVKSVTLRVKEDSYEFSIRPRIEPERYILARGVLGRLPVLPSWPHRSTAGSEARSATLMIAYKDFFPVQQAYVTWEECLTIFT
jgi:hypothetical protein